MQYCFKTFLTLGLLFTIITDAQAAKIYRTIHYYSISGKTGHDLIQALRVKGPYVESTKSHHPGATSISFLPDIHLKKVGKYCRVTRANIDIRAKIQLPKWRQRATTRNPALAFIWDTLSQDIKRHEESHAIIARSHASEMEMTIHKLPVRKKCDDLRQNIISEVEKMLKKHMIEQIQFDYIEGINFKKRLSRLLKYRAEKMNEHQ